MKALESKIKKSKTPKVQFSIFDTHWIEIDFINHEGFKHRKLRDFTLEKMPFISVGIYDFYVMYWAEDAVRIMHNKINDEALICAADFALFGGYQDMENMILDNQFLDDCLTFQQNYKRFPIKKIIVTGEF